MIKYKIWVYRNLLFLYYMFLFLLPITSQLRKQVYTLLLHTTSALHICLALKCRYLKVVFKKM